VFATPPAMFAKQLVIDKSIIRIKAQMAGIDRPGH
jgi:hypothetical protein